MIIGGQNSINLGGNGITITKAQQIYLANVELASNANGLVADSNTQNMRIESCFFGYNGADGFDFSGQSLYMLDCSFTENGQYGIHTLSGSSDITIINSVAYVINNQSVGFNIESSRASLYGCTAMMHSLAGFLINSQYSSYIGCTAMENFVGFHVTNSFNLLQSCSANQNHTEFLIDGTFNIVRGCIANDSRSLGFQINSSSNIIQECISNNNTTFGFQDTTSAGANQYYSNRACNNTSGNYSGPITSAPITSPNNVHGVENIDCTNTTINKIKVMESFIACIAKKVGC